MTAKREKRGVRKGRESTSIPRMAVPSNFSAVVAPMGLVLFRRRCDTLCTSGLVDDVVLSHNGLLCGASCVFLAGESVYNSRNYCIDST